ncbi:MAG: signal peptidase II [Clostridiales bacterium]|nr:signal peptidase II [Clostridiales bacterium]
MIEIIIAVVLLILDQITKHLAFLYCQQPIVLIPGVLELSYAQNTGAAWGILDGLGVVLVALVLVVCALLAWFYIKKHKVMRPISRVTLALIFAGALGNGLDRIALGYVRDMIYFRLINFPVFNLADICITIGAGLFILETFFFKNNLFDIWEDMWKNRKKK